MSEELPVSKVMIIDRRNTGRGKSLPNRERLLRRIKEYIRDSNPNTFGASGVKGTSAQSTGTTGASPVAIARSALYEPTFHYASSTGEHDIVLIGNKTKDGFERGDDFPLSGEEEGSGGGPGEDGEDDFVINISREEFLKYFFEDCELPNLQETAERDIPELMPKHAGFSRDGNPAQLSLSRSYKQSFPRRRALTKAARDELEELELEQANLQARLDENPLDASANARWKEVTYRIEELKAKIAGVPFFEHVDLRYRKSEKVLVKSADAVFIMVMDVSGSMGEEEKRIARKMFSLQYAFIQRHYPQTDLVFIAHTDTPHEMTEEEFFTTRLSGGTVISPAYELVHKIIKERYDHNTTNIYLSQVTDGDNWTTDNPLIIPALEGSGLLAKLRHMCYIQVMNGYGGYGADQFFTIMKSIKGSNPKLDLSRIQNEEEVFGLFKDIYRRRDKKGR